MAQNQYPTEGQTRPTTSSVRTGDGTGMTSQIMNHQHVTYFSWRAVFAGVFVASICLITLMTLGLAFRASSYDPGEAAFSWGSFIWGVLAIVISLFVGSYLAGRVSNFRTAQIGAAQGFVTAAVLFLVMLSQASIGAAWLSGNVTDLFQSSISATSRIAGSNAGMLSQLAQNPAVQDVIEGALSEVGVQLPEDPAPLIESVIARVLTGNASSVPNLLARRLNISEAEVRANLDKVGEAVTKQINEFTSQAATTISAVSWALFISIVLGTAAAIYGGIAGSTENTKHPLLEQDELLLRRQERAS